MDTKDTAEKTARSVARATPAPKPRLGEPNPKEPVPSVPLSGLGDDSLEGLGAAFSGLSVGGPEGKEKRKDCLACTVGGARSQQRKIQNQEKDVQPERIKGKIVFSDLRNPPKIFTPLFGEVAKFRTLTENQEQKSRDGDEVEHCLPQNT